MPGKTVTETPGSSRMTPASGKIAGGGVDWNHPGIYQHIGYPSVVADAGRHDRLLVPRVERRPEAAAIRPLHALPRLSRER